MQQAEILPSEGYLDVDGARLAAKLTGWRIDIKDPAALQEMDEDLLRQARASMAESQADDFSWQGRQPRLVRADRLVVARSR